MIDWPIHSFTIEIVLWSTHKKFERKSVRSGARYLRKIT